MRGTYAGRIDFFTFQTYITGVGNKEAAMRKDIDHPEKSPERPISGDL